VSLTIAVATASPTPSAGDDSYGSMKRQIAAIAGRQRDPKGLDLAGSFICDRIDDLNRMQVWDFNIVTSPDITTSVGVATYAIPGDFWKIYNTRKTDVIDFQLSTMRQRTFDTMFVAQRNIQGYPYILVIKNTFRGGTVTLFPTPSGAYTISLNYYKLIAKPSQDDDVLDIPQPYQGAVKYHAMMRMAALAGDQVSLGMYRELANAAYAQMNRSDDDIPDENLRFVQTEELSYRSSYQDPSVRPRAYDLW
jgi:hypothetical protein